MLEQFQAVDLATSATIPIMIALLSAQGMRFTRQLFAAALLVVVGGACHKVTDPDPRIGTYLATTFTITPSGQAPINVLTQGGTLGLNIANNFVTAGTLILPPSVTGGAAVSASMAGTADTTGGKIRFVQTADTFVRNLTFTMVETRLEAVNQTVAGTTYTVVLNRQ
jgi:hypothetical protein